MLRLTHSLIYPIHGRVVWVTWSADSARYQPKKALVKLEPGEYLKRRPYESRKYIKISDKFTTHAAQMDELYHKNAVGKIISISKDVKDPQSRFLNKSKSNRIDGYSHSMTKTERYLRSLFFVICHTIFKWLQL